jgi:ankyrin repeat protein
LLLEHGAAVQDEQQREDRSPVFLAAVSGHTDIVRLLMEKGALLDSCDEFGWTMLHQAVRRGKPDLVELLLKYKAELGYTAPSPNSDSTCPDGRPMHMAAALGKVDVLRAFIENGVSADNEDIQKQTPLHFAASFGQPEAVRFLVNSGADINAFTNWRATPLHMAAENGNVHVISCLVEKGAAVDAEDDEGRTPLFCALENGNLDAVYVLMNSGADMGKAIDCKVYHNQFTLLHLAAKAGYSETVEFLLAHGADVNSTDGNGVSALHYAVHYDHYEIVRVLIAHGAEINTVCDRFDYRNERFTPLDLACSFKIWKLLYEAGARPGAEKN